MMKRLLKILLVVLLLLAAAAGGLFLARPKVLDGQRRAAEEALIAQIEQGETQLAVPSLPEMEGEALEFPEFAAAALREEDTGEPQTLTGCGLIEIPAIELKMALVRGADSYALRAAAGWLPESAEPGGAGNCAVFGHRMREYGRQFNRLDELAPGDQVILTVPTGTRYTYTVTGSEVIDPGGLMDALTAHNEGFSLTLVTCTPIAVCTQRLLVYAELTN